MCRRPEVVSKNPGDDSKKSVKLRFAYNWQKITHQVIISMIVIIYIFSILFLSI